MVQPILFFHHIIAKMFLYYLEFALYQRSLNHNSLFSPFKKNVCSVFILAYKHFFENIEKTWINQDKNPAFSARNAGENEQ